MNPKGTNGTKTAGFFVLLNLKCYKSKNSRAIKQTMSLKCEMNLVETDPKILQRTLQLIKHFAVVCGCAIFCEERGWFFCSRS